MRLQLGSAKGNVASIPPTYQCGKALTPKDDWSYVFATQRTRSGEATHDFQRSPQSLVMPD